MSYTSQQLIEYLHDLGYTEQEIADVTDSRRETINRIRRGKPGYQGVTINGKLLEIVRMLQRQGTPAPPAPVPPARQVPQSASAGQQAPCDTRALFDQTHCSACPLRSLVPFGVTKQQYKQWEQANVCTTQVSRQCPR